MATTDLTNTTWILHDEISTLDNTLIECDVDFTFTITNETSDIVYSCNKIKADTTSLSSGGFGIYYYRIYDDSSENFYQRVYGDFNTGKGYEWAAQFFRTITFIGGADIKDSNLISWLEDNAELQGGEVEPTLTYDLSQLDLPEGTHSITVVAKADGYSNSAPSNAVEYVVEASLPVWNGTDLTGTIWEINSGWSATSGYGVYDVYGRFDYPEQTSTQYFTSFKIGYKDNKTQSNYVTWYNGTSVYGYYPNSQRLVIKFISGTHLTKTSLISWLKQYGTLTSHTMA
jgi:hypothetical protein